MHVYLKTADGKHHLKIIQQFNPRNLGASGGSAAHKRWQTEALLCFPLVMFVFSVYLDVLIIAVLPHFCSWQSCQFAEV